MSTASMEVSPVTVRTTSGRGFTPEELAEQCVDKIIHISASAPEPLRAQAEAFRGSVQDLIALYLRQAVNSDRTTVYSALAQAGQSEAADIIRRL